jgi:hypothetical protein
MLWGPRGSGKTSCTLHVCNKLLQDKRISGVVRCKCIPYYEIDNDAGTNWFNESIGAPALKRGRQISNSLLPKTDKRTYPEKIVFVFDQVDNIIPCTASEAILKAFDTYITNLAEDAQFCDTYTILMCSRNPFIAERIIRLNGGSKISHIGPYALQHKWTDQQIINFFPGVKEDPSLLELCRSAGTPQFCMDAVRFNDTALKKQAPGVVF